MSKPQIILNAGCAAIAMAIAYRMANLMIDRVLPKRKGEEEETADRRQGQQQPRRVDVAIHTHLQQIQRRVRLGLVRGFLLFDLLLGQHAV